MGGWYLHTRIAMGAGVSHVRKAHGWGQNVYRCSNRAAVLGRITW